MDSSFVGRFIRMKLRSPQINQYDKKVRGNTKLFLASVYHPVDEFEHIEFINILSSIVNSVPKTAEFIGGHDVNANVGTRSKIYRKTLGPREIDNRNIKGRRLLGFFSNNQIKIANSFFTKPSIVTWRYFSKMRSPHKLDVRYVFNNLFKCVRSCGVSKKGTISNHSAVRLDFMNRSIKYKTTFIKKPVIDCNAIKERDNVNENFNVNLRNLI